MIRVVIFDLDDTLISETDYVKSGYRHIAKLLSHRFGKDENSLFESLNNLFEEDSRFVFNRILDDMKIDYSKEDVLKIVAAYRNHLPNIGLYHDVLPCVKSLNEDNIKTGIITDGYTNAQRQKLKAIHADDYFDKIIVTDELGRAYWKPHPRAFQMMRDKFEVEFQEMLFVGDNPEKDFYISSIYPISTARIYRNGVYKNKDYFKNIEEDYSINSLNELSHCLR